MVSITAAAVFSFTLLAKVVERMVSLSVGIMLSTSLLHALPEAFESKADTHALFATLLGGLLAFFLLEKVALLRHSHHHEGDGHHHAHGHDAMQAGRAGWMILIGDGMHNFTDGILIAAAFLANPQLGIVTGVAIIAHEIPQEIGDYALLRAYGMSRGRALFWLAMVQLTAGIGAVGAFYASEISASMNGILIALASGTFLYIGATDLLPEIHVGSAAQRKHRLLGFLLGVGLVVLASFIEGH